MEYVAYPHSRVFRWLENSASRANENGFWKFSLRFSEFIFSTENKNKHSHRTELLYLELKACSRAQTHTGIRALAHTHTHTKTHRNRNQQTLKRKTKSIFIINGKYFLNVFAPNENTIFRAKVFHKMHANLCVRCARRRYIAIM